MTWRRWALGAAVLAAIAAAVGGRVGGQGQTDITGRWTANFTFAGIAGPCAAAVYQAGTLLSLSTECGSALHGAIDPDTGAFELTGLARDPFFAVDVRGTASSSADTLEGRWERVVGSMSGSFEATRDDRELAPFNLSGIWTMPLAGIEDEACSAHVAHENEDLFVDVSCPEEGSGSLTGTIDPSTGAFALSGSLFGSDTDAEGVVSLNGLAMAGAWFAPSAGPMRTFNGSSAERIDGKVVIDCDATAAGVQVECSRPVGTEFDVHVGVAEAPTGGYAAVEMLLRWSAVVDYLPTGTPGQEAIAEVCRVPIRDVRTEPPSGPSVLFACVFSSADDVTDFEGAMARFRMTCVQEGRSALMLPQGPGANQFVDSANRRISANVQDATVVCDREPSTITTKPTATPTPTATATAPTNVLIGDVNCNGIVNSIDGGLMLQFSAGLIPSLACQHLGDLGGTGVINSIDALLVLQCNAGLFDCQV